MGTLDDLLRARRQKLEKLLSLGIDPFPEAASLRTEIREVRKNFAKLGKSKKQLTIAGRLVGLRYHGGAVFGDVKDASDRIQILFKKDLLGEEFDLLLNFDLGDFLEATGNLFKTKAGEETIEVRKFRMLAKASRPLPSEWYGLEDVEERFRRRYLDLLSNPEVFSRFAKRSRIITELRRFLDGEGFLEVETPILQTLYGGAAARPFKSNLDILHLPLYLRIAPELYLKRLLVGGFEKVYEIGKVFRNEGIDRDHNPEFTMLELYWAYQDREGMMDFSEELFTNVANRVGAAKKNAFVYQGNTVSLKRPWKRMQFAQLLKDAVGFDYDSTSEEDLRKAAEAKGLVLKTAKTKGKVAEMILDKLVLPKVREPIFVIDYPVEISPLAKSKEGIAKRFELFLAGLEVMNGFSELNDPEDQRKRFEEQEKQRRRGDEEAHPVDEDYIEALEYGMPPAAGLGVGVDRLVALLTDAPNLKEVILFPFMRPK